jgi:UDP-glucose:(heptosyl)LPS alpha-1,3-glucosyltransferase
MEALRLLLRRGITDVRSLVIGKGDTHRWHHLAARLGVTRHLTLTGPSDRVQALRCAGDVLVHPTYYDPCSRVVLEALAAGLPCISTRWDGASEMIEDGVNGFVIPDPADVEGLATCVEQLRDAALRRSMAESARTAARRVTMERHVAEMLSLYKQMLAPVA